MVYTSLTSPENRDYTYYLKVSLYLQMYNFNTKNACRFAF